VFTVRRRSTTVGVGRHTQQKRRMATAGSGSPLAKGPKEDQAGVSAAVGGSLPADGQDMGATTAARGTVRAGGAQAAQEGAPHQRGEAQRAALLEQAGEEKRTAQQARLTSIREQQASLAAQPIVRWLFTVPAEARVESTEARPAATETLTPAEACREPTEKEASAKAAMGKPARPPDRLNEQSAVTSAVFVQEPG
jgi:hypothetical protein